MVKRQLPIVQLSSAMFHNQPSNQLCGPSCLWYQGSKLPIYLIFSNMAASVIPSWWISNPSRRNWIYMEKENTTWISPVPNCSLFCLHAAGILCAGWFWRSGIYTYQGKSLGGKHQDGLILFVNYSKTSVAVTTASNYVGHTQRLPKHIVYIPEHWDNCCNIHSRWEWL